MRLATMPDGTRDGRLVVVSSDGKRAARPAAASTLLDALERWADVEPQLREFARAVDADDTVGAPFDETEALAPLPRTWQWLDASAFLEHGKLLSKSLGMEPIVASVPLMYQGLSHQFLQPVADVPFASADADIDFEGEFAVILRDVPAGVSADAALEYIALITFVNDWSFRRTIGEEMGRKFGFIQAKPATGAAPLAATSDELGEGWAAGRVHLPLSVRLNGKRFGDVSGTQMSYSFGDLIAFAAENRDLPAGTILGSGTVSSTDYLEVGSACIAERRGIEMIHAGGATTPYVTYGDEVEMFVESGERSLFGRLRQRAVPRSDS
jgi:fumarylacetoacetate (FAA) hydrolase